MSVLGLLINPTAGRGRGRRDGNKVARLLNDAGHETIDFTSESLLAASQRARQGVVDGVDAIVAVGGDGIVHVGANIVAGTSLPLGIVAAGTGNDIARGLGLPLHDPQASVRVLLEGLASGGRRIDAVEVGGEGYGAREWFVGILSAGIDAAANRRTNETRWPRSKARYLRALVHELRHLHPYDYRVSVDDAVVWDGPGLLATVANGISFGGGLKIAPGSLFDDGEISVIAVDPVSLPELLRVLPRLRNGTHMSHPAVHQFSGARVVLEAGKPVDRDPVVPPIAFADGEQIGPVPLICEVVPGAIRLLVGGTNGA